MDLAAVPDGTHIRFRFELHVENFLLKLADQLQTNAEGVFVALQDPLQGSDVSPFYLELLSNADLAQESCETISKILSIISANFELARGQVLPVCTVDESGRVSLRVLSGSCLLISNYLFGVLPNIKRSPSDDHFHVSIGSFQGPHNAAFEIWLNKELARNGAIFPSFQCHYVEVSEECSALIENPIRRLAGSVQGTKSSPASSPKVDTAVNFLTPTDNHSSRSHLSRSTTGVKFSMEERLHTSITSITEQISGSGIIFVERVNTNISTGNSPIASVRCHVIPVERKKWQDQCLKVFSILDGMLQAVGPKNFVKCLDEVANPASKSIISVLQPWIEKGYGSIQLCVNEEFRIAAISSHEDRNTMDLSGIEIPLSVCSMESHAAIGSSSAMCSSSSEYDEVQQGSYGKGTESPLLCFPVPYDFSPVNPQGSWRILISLHVSADPFLACGLRPVEGLQEFYLPIGWIDGVLKHSTNRNPQSSGVQRSRFMRETDRAPSHRNDTRYQPSYIENASIHSSYQTQGYISDHISSRVPSYLSHPSHSPQSAVVQHQYIRPAMAFYPMYRGPNNLEGLQSHHAGSVESPVMHQTNNFPHGFMQGQNLGQGQQYCALGRPSVNTERSYSLHNQPLPKQLQLQSKQQKGKLPHPGDWICSACDALVFSFRPTCYNCHSPQHSSDQHIVPRQPPKTAERPDGDLRDGDWICSGCQGHNFSSKIACFTCRMPRTPSALSSLATKGLEREGTVRPQTVMPGDWICPTCKENVFAKRHRCYKCSTSKPR